MEYMYIPTGIKRELVRFDMITTGRGKLSGLLEENKWLFILSSRHTVVLTSDDFHSIFPPSPPLLPLPVSQPLWLHFSKTLMWRHLYCVFIYIYSLLIEKNICDHQNVSIKLPCVFVCLLSGDLFIFLVRVSSFFPYF